MEQLILILLVALISIINWIVQKSKERREQRKLEKRADATGESLKGAPAESPPPETQTETAMRRLREALGLPEEAEPPIIPKRVSQRSHRRSDLRRPRFPSQRGSRSSRAFHLPLHGWSIVSSSCHIWRIASLICHIGWPSPLRRWRFPGGLRASANFLGQRAACAMPWSFPKSSARRKACAKVSFADERPIFRAARRPPGEA